MQINKLLSYNKPNPIGWIALVNNYFIQTE